MDTRRLKMWNVRVMSVVAFAFLLALIAEPAYAQVFRINVRMNSTQEVPSLTAPGTAAARITVNTTTRAISGTVNFSGLSAPATAGHIHLAPAGSNGPVIIPLVGGLRVTSGRMRVPPATVLLPAQLRALRSNRLYLNIHTSANPGGEIRGQILFGRRVPVASLNQAPMTKLVIGNFIRPVKWGTAETG